jgi:hypothetical protein
MSNLIMNINPIKDRILKFFFILKIQNE